MKKYLKIDSSVGHGFFQLNMAEAMKLEPVILPEAENEEEFNKKSQEIWDKLNIFSSTGMKKIRFEERQKYIDQCYDVLTVLKKGNPLPWAAFAENTLQPQQENATEYPRLTACTKKKVLMVPQKLLSDNVCGVTAQQQSLNPSVFNFLKEEKLQLVLGQHFNKVSDKETVDKLAEEFGMYIPGQEEESSHVYGIRGILHEDYLNMYKLLNGSVGIAGTHTWIMLTVFPSIPQVILYNRNGVEKWEEIEQAYRAAGHPIRCIGFDDTTDMTVFSKQVENACFELGII